MDRPADAQDREWLLAFVERHWRELTLHDARLISVERLDELPQSLPAINASLISR